MFPGDLCVLSLSLSHICVGLQVITLFVLGSAGGCQKRLRDDVGSDDKDFIKRMKGDFDRPLTRFSDSQGFSGDFKPSNSPPKHCSGLVVNMLEYI